MSDLYVISWIIGLIAFASGCYWIFAQLPVSVPIAAGLLLATDAAGSPEGVEVGGIGGPEFSDSGGFEFGEFGGFDIGFF